MITDTPRTDSVAFKDGPSGLELVHADTSRTLERDLSSVTEERDSLKRALNDLIKAKEQDAMRWCVDKDRANAAEQQLAASREAVELADAALLWSVNGIGGLTGEEAFNKAHTNAKERALSASAAKEGK